MPADKITSLGGFIDRVAELRKKWKLSAHKELWFRGESEKYKTCLRPELYRPRNEKLKSIDDLLEIETDLYNDFERRAVQLAAEEKSDEYWHWDSYFLMQHHLAPTRLLDWSDGALIALHFAVRNKPNDVEKDAVVYVLQPYELRDKLDTLAKKEHIDKQWKEYVESHPGQELSEDEWEDCYLPRKQGEDRANLKLPSSPLVLDMPHISRRVAAQRSQFIIFGTDPSWLSKSLRRPHAPIAEIVIAGYARDKIRLELRDTGVSESVIFPDLDGLGREIRQLWDDRR
jgi:FRG domain